MVLFGRQLLQQAFGEDVVSCLMWQVSVQLVKWCHLEASLAMLRLGFWFWVSEARATIKVQVHILIKYFLWARAVLTMWIGTSVRILCMKRS